MTGLLDIDDSIFDDLDGDDVAPQRAAAETALTRNPDEYAKTLSLSEKTGLPTGTVERNRAEVEQRVRLDDIDMDSVLKDVPEAKNWAADADNMSMVSDDFSIFGRAKKVFSDLPEGFSRSMDDLSSINLIDKEMSGTATPEEQLQWREMWKKNSSQLGTGGVFSDIAIGAARSSVPMVNLFLESQKQGLATGLAFAGTAAAAGQLGPQAALPEEIITAPVGGAIGYTVGTVSGGLKEGFRQMRAMAYGDIATMKDEEGNTIDPQTARFAANIIGAASAPLEFIGFTKILKTIPGGDALAKKLTREGVRELLTNKTMRAAIKTAAVKYGDAMFTEGVTEGTQQLMQELGTEWAKAEANKTQGTEFEPDTVGEIAANVGYSTLIGSGVGGVYSTPGTAVSVYQARNRYRSPDGVAMQAKALNDEMRQNALLQRSPERAHRLFQDMTGDERYYIDAEVVGQAINQLAPEQQEALFKAAPDLQAEIQNSSTTGADISIKKADYAAFIAPYPQADTLVEHLKLDPADESQFARNTRLKFMAAFPDNAKALTDYAGEMPEISVQEQEKAIERIVRKSLTDAGRGMPEARVLAPLFAKSFARRAQAVGIDPVQFFTENALGFQTIDENGNVVKQGGNINVLLNDLDNVRAGKGNTLDAATRQALADFSARMEQRGITPEQARTMQPSELLDAVYSTPDQPAATGETQQLPQMELPLELQDIADGIDQIAVSLSAATDTIPGISQILENAKAGDQAAHKALQDIAVTTLQNLTEGIPSVIIEATPATGLYGGSVEPSLGVSVRFDRGVRAEVLSALARFAENFNQEQVHVRGHSDAPVGTLSPDGSYTTEAFKIRLSRPLTRDEVDRIISESGLYGLTFADNYWEAYYVGEPENDAAIAEFDAAIERAVSTTVEIGAGDGAIESETQSLWIYGVGSGAIPYDTIAGDVRSGEDQADSNARIIAEYFTRGVVKPREQASTVTDPQRQIQRKIALDYEAMPDNDMSNPLVRQAYEALRDAVIKQFRELPLKEVTAHVKRDEDGNVVYDENGDPVGASGEPYKNSAEMRRDVRKRNRMTFYATTKSTFGPEGIDFSGHQLLEETEFRDSNGYPLLVNDILRVVHDYYAHNLTATNFGPRGEEAAWVNHMTTIDDPMARWALTSETRGQNSWVNFRPGAELIPKLIDRGFARQKAALLPIEYSLTGDAEIDAPMQELIASLTPEQQNGSVPTEARATDDVVAQAFANDNEAIEQKQRKRLFQINDSMGDVFFSQLTRSIEGLQQAKGTADQWKGIIKNLAQKGVKQEEIEWTGVNDWLDAQEGSVTKEALVDYLQKSQLNVEEVVQNEDTPSEVPTYEEVTDEFWNSTTDPERVEMDDIALSEETNYQMDNLRDEIGDDLEAAYDDWSHLIDRIDDDETGETTYELNEEALREYAEQNAISNHEEFGDMTMRGEVQGHEVVAVWNMDAGTLTINGNDRSRYMGRITDEGDIRMMMWEEISGDLEYRDDDDYGGTQFSEYTMPGEHENYHELLLTLPDIQDRGVSQHFRDNNVMMHIRFNERTDAEGKRVMFVEEMQSDWHQQGRKKGYKIDPPYNEETLTGLRADALIAIKRLDNLGFDAPGVALGEINAWMLDDPTADWTKNWDADINDENVKIVDKYIRARAENYMATSSGTIADAPFKTSWPELGLKRVIRWAVEQGFERVAWTTGEMQAARYASALEREIDQVVVRQADEEGFVTVGVIANGRGNVSEFVARQVGAEVRDDGDVKLTHDQLEDVFGKGMAEQIVTASKTEGGETISGNGLKIADKGMVGFYDKMLPKLADKTIKKYGSKVKPTKIDFAYPTIYEVDQSTVPTLEQVNAKLAEFEQQVRETYDKPHFIQALKDSGRFEYSDIENELFSPTSVREPHGNPTQGRAMRGYIRMLSKDYDVPVTQDPDFEDTYDTFELARKRIASGTPFVLKPGKMADALGITVNSRQNIPEVWSFDVTDQMKESVQSGLPLFQDARGYIDFENGLKNVMITFTEKANFSTGVHEFSHWAVATQRMFSRVARQRIAEGDDNPELSRIVEDWEALKKKVGAPGDIFTVEQEEQIAKMFEAYMREGNAPSEGLRRVFTRFRDWLLSIYQDLSRLGTDLDDETRAVFDRWLAAENEVSKIKDKNHTLAMIAQQLGLDTSVQDNVAEYVNGALSMAEEALFKKLRAEQKQRESAEYKDAFEKMRVKVAEEFEGKPEYAAVDYLRKQNMKLLDGPELEGIDPSLLTDKVNGENTVLPDEIADLFGYQTGRALITALKNAPDRDRAIDREVRQRLQEKFPDMRADGRLSDEALAAIYNDRTLLALDTMIKEIGKSTGQNRVNMRQFAKVIAQQQLMNMKASDTGYAFRWDAARDKEMRNALQFARNGAAQMAMLSLQKAMVNHMLYKQMVQFNEEKQKAFELFKTVNQKDRKLAKSNDIDYVGAARGILNKFGMSNENFDVGAWLDDVALREPAIRQDLIKLSTMVQTPAKKQEDLTVAEFLDIRDTVENIMWVARSTKNVQILGKQIEREKIIFDLNEQLDKLPQHRRMHLTQNGGDRVRSWAMSVKSTMRRMEHWVNAMDGGYGGVTRKYIWEPIVNAENTYKDEKPKMMKELNVILQRHKKRLEQDGKIPAPNLTSEKFGGVFRDRMELIGFLLHTGNASNLEKLLDGYGINRANFDAFMADAYRTQLITKQDMQIVQDLWNFAERLKPLSQRAHKDLYGFRFDEIEASPVITPFGTYGGGYWPAIVDYTIVEDGDIRQAQDQANGINNSFMLPTTGKGFSMNRVDQYRRPLSTDLRLATSHVDKVMRFVYLEPAIRDVSRIINDRSYRDKLQLVDEFAGRNMLNPWLQRVARQETQVIGRSWEHSKVWSFIRSSASAQAMMLNLLNAVQNLTGISVAMHEVGVTNFGKALGRYVMNPMGAGDEVRQMSTEMRVRQNLEDNDIANAVNDIILRRGSVKKAKNWAIKHGYVFQRLIQNFVDNVTWMAGYDKAVQEGMTDADAIRYADSAVRITQGSLSAKDISTIEASTSFGKLFLMFYSYFNNLSNLQGSSATNIIRKTGWKGAPELVYMYLMTAAIPFFVAELMVKGLRGDLPEDEDDDGLWDEYLTWFAMSNVRGNVAQVPFAGQIGNAFLNRHNDLPMDDRITISPVVSMTETAVRFFDENLFGDGYDDDSRMVRDALSTFGFMTGLPLGQLGKPLGYLADVNEGDTTPENPLDFARGIVGGPPPQNR